MKRTAIGLMASCALSSLLACGGAAKGPDGSGVAIPPSAHSSSFFPVQGVLDDGQPAGELYWDYRVDHGQPHINGFAASQTLQFQDQIQTVEAATLKQTLSAAISGSASGTSSQVVTEQIDPKTANILSMTSDTNTALNTGSAEIDSSYSWMPPSPGFFDRTDLDTLAIGHSENAEASASVSGTVTANSAVQGYMGTASVSSSWTLMGKLATYTVLGVAYDDVVQVQVTSTSNVQLTTSTGQSSSGTTSATTSSWLARGIGVVYSETTTQQQSGSDTSVIELAATNLVPSGSGDAGADARPE